MNQAILEKNNVTRVRIKNVYRTINAFLTDIESKNTKREYKSDITLFFSVMLGKSFAELNENDLDFDVEDIIDYKQFLMDKNYANSTVNRKLNTMKSLYKFFKINRYNVLPEVFDINRLSIKGLDTYDSITYNEALEMIERVKKQYKGHEKSLLIELAVKTSIRQNALLNMKWSDISISDKDKDIYLIEVIDKGEKKDDKPISINFYKRLLSLKGEHNDDAKIFHITVKTARKMIKKLAEDMNIADRNIVFHSLKKTMINWTLDNLGDMKLARIQGNHESEITFLKHYTKYTKDFSKMPSILVEQEIDLSIIENASREELIKALKSSNLAIQNKVISELKKGIK